jgi:3-dehydroquinate dehydratase-2
MRILVLNGPNLDRLGEREPAIYGHRSMESWLVEMRALYPEHRLDHVQSNLEGVLIEELRRADAACDGVVLNPAGYAHTSVALRDALAMMRKPVVEVHLSNVHAREPYRHVLLTAAACAGCISGLGLDGYRLALEWLLRRPL